MIIALDEYDYPPGFTDYVQPLFNARQRTLQRMTRQEKLVCRHILEIFPVLGHGPSVDELVASTGLPRTHVVESLGRLDSCDMLKYDAQAGQVLVLYPLSDIPCPDRVHLRGWQPLYAM
jgi:hypothetical protein